MLGKRVRPVLSDEIEEFPLTKDRMVEGLECLIMSGRQAGSTVEMPACELRPANVRKCYCNSYAFPHAPGLGKCTTGRWEGEAPETIDLNSLFIEGGST